MCERLFIAPPPTGPGESSGLAPLPAAALSLHAHCQQPLAPAPAQAILGLRSLYVLLADALERVNNLQQGLGVVLGFVGAKMVLADVIHIPQLASLGIIVAILVATVYLGGGIIGKEKPKDDSDLKGMIQMQENL